MYSTGHIKDMSNQPKPRKHKAGCPALGGYGHGPEPCICGADKPTTGEWTSQTVHDLYRMLDGGFRAIADAHNAALDAAIAEARQRQEREDAAKFFEYTQPLVDALKEFATQLDWVLQHAHNVNGEARENLASIRDAALAKVKEAK